MLLEGQRTNVIKQSQDYTTGDYILSNITSININFATSPSGALNSQKVNFGTGASYVRSKESLASALSCSIFAKYVDYPYLQIMIGGDSEHYANFDVQNGTTGNVGTKSTASIEDYGNGWYRIIINSLSGTFGSAPRIYKIDNLLASWGTGGGAAGSCLLWGFQLELGSYSTSLINTTTTAVTRLADEVTLNNVYTNNLITASGGTWFIHILNNIEKVRDTVGGLYLAQTNAYNSSNGFRIGQTSATESRLKIVRYLGGVATTYQTTADIIKIAISWNGTTWDLWENGIKVVSAEAFTFTALEYLASNLDIAYEIQSQELYPTALTDIQLATLTTL